MSLAFSDRITRNAFVFERVDGGARFLLLRTEVGERFVASYWEEVLWVVDDNSIQDMAPIWMWLRNIVRTAGDYLDINIRLVDQQTLDSFLQPDEQQEREQEQRDLAYRKWVVRDGPLPEFGISCKVCGGRIVLGGTGMEEAGLFYDPAHPEKGTIWLHVVCKTVDYADYDLA